MIVAQAVAGVAAAAPAAAVPAPIGLLEYLIVGGLMGMLGQGARAVIGLKEMSTDARTLNLNPNDVFETGRLITSIIIGFLVGLAAALVTLKSGDTIITIPGWTTLLGWLPPGMPARISGRIDCAISAAGRAWFEAQKLVAADQQKADDAKTKAATKSLSERTLPRCS